MRHLKSTLAVLGAAVILVLAGNTIALAATGKGFLLGKSNTATKITVLKRTTSGTPLSIHSKSSSNAPLQVNGSGKVANLNADKVDGLDSSQLRTHTYVFTKAVSAQSSVDMAINLPKGSYTFGYAAYMPGVGTAGGEAGCYFVQSNPTAYFGETRLTTIAGSTPSFSGNAVITMATGRTLTLHCFAPSAITTLSNEPIQITATPTTIVGGSALRVAPSSARLAH